WDDAREMRQVRLHIDGNAMEAHPAPEPDADRGDLVLGWRSVGQGWPVGPDDPDPDAIFPAFAPDIEAIERADDPLLRRGHEGADIFSPALEVEHDIGDPLARSVIGVFSATPGGENGKPVGLDKVLGPGAGAGRVEWWMLD